MRKEITRKRSISKSRDTNKYISGRVDEEQQLLYLFFDGEEVNPMSTMWQEVQKTIDRNPLMHQEFQGPWNR